MPKRAATVAVATNLSPQSYVVTAIGADGVTESLASAVVTGNNNLTLAGNYNTLSWSAVTGATRYNAYKRRGGSYGYIGQTVTLSGGGAGFYFQIAPGDSFLGGGMWMPPKDALAKIREAIETAYREGMGRVAYQPIDGPAIWFTPLGKTPTVAPCFGKPKGCL